MLPSQLLYRLWRSTTLIHRSRLTSQDGSMYSINLCLSPVLSAKQAVVSLNNPYCFASRMSRKFSMFAHNRGGHRRSPDSHLLSAYRGSSTRSQLVSASPCFPSPHKAAANAALMSAKYGYLRKSDLQGHTQQSVIGSHFGMCSITGP